MKRIKVGAWRDDNGGPLEVVSGAMGRERIQFEAPAAERRNPEIEAFLDWFNGNTEGDWVVKAGLAHLWFVTIHPFENGNGRIARAIADLGAGAI
jgi:Fic family protein